MKRKTLATLAFGGTVALVATAGALFNPSRGETRDWYRSLDKSSLNPPDTVFGPVWSLLYALVAISGARVWLADGGESRTRALQLWGTQMTLNGAWSPLFFGAKKPAVALVDIVALLAAITLYTNQARRVDRPAAWMMLPYFAWVAFATFLNEEVVRRNAGVLAG